MTVSRSLLPMLLGVYACLGSANPAGAVVRYVDSRAAPGGNGLSWPTAYNSLSTALTAAQPGDQIWVAAGRYVGNFTLALGVELYGGFAGTETELTQRDWTANRTILDGNSAGSVVTSPPGAAATTRIDRFTITNGSGTVSGPYSYAYGGGVYLDSSSPTITNNTITGNTAYYGGGGLYLYESSPTIADNMITNNSAAQMGGGLYLYESSSAIVNNTIMGNSAYYAGGLYVYGSSPTIANNRISGNGSSIGGGMYISSSSPTIADNMITSNSATQVGGGINLYCSSPTIAGNTVAGNSARSEGGGLYLTSSLPTIANTIVAFNSSGIHQEDSSSTATLRHNCVYGNAEYNFSGMSDPTGTDGNIFADPRLADLSYGNMHIQPESPCIDAGNNADSWGDSDVDLQPRIQPSAGTVDIGADESDGTAWAAGPYAIVRVSPLGDDANDGSSWALAKRTVQAGIDAASAVGGEVWVQADRYYERITLHPHAYVYGGFGGGEAVRDERDWGTNVTTLDGQLQGSVVTARAGYGPVSTIDGFTITNGSGNALGIYAYGGGVYVFQSSPTIANNVVKWNKGTSGGGLYLYSSSATIANNTIMGNSAPSGGGLYLNSSYPLIANNRIIGNSGAGLYLYDSSPTITNNTITSNDGIHGAGLYLRGSSPTMANTIVAFNSSGIRQYAGGTPTLRHNCVYGNGADNYSGLTDPTGTDGNISTDPRLADPRYGNVHIQANSPCVDAGNNGDAFGDFDMDGQGRILPLGGTADIGADESDGTLWVLGPYTIVRVSTLLGDDANDGSDWGEAKRTVQAGIDAATALGGDVWVRHGTYQECITLHPYAYVYGGFAGGETQRNQRNWHANVTTLDGQQRGSVVTGQAGYQVSAVDGFTITNGSGTVTGSDLRGGGVWLRFSSPTIANNTITGNSALWGAGLYVDEASPTIVNNTITGNSDAYYGGGLCLFLSFATIANNTISDNNGRVGGGLSLLSASPTIVNNTVTGNIANSTIIEGGGGLSLHHSSPTIANNMITDNSALFDGGGLHLYRSSPMITDNTIGGNIADGGGGGVYLDQSSPTIANNTITDNTAHGSGGGLFCDDTAMIVNNIIAGNRAFGAGGGLVCGSLETIANNTIRGNSATRGGGVWLSGYQPTIVNNTITGNSASEGGGLWVNSYDAATIANTIIAFNSSGIHRKDTSHTPALRYNCVYGNTGYNYFGLTDPTGTDGNISADPLFVQRPDPGPDGTWGTPDDNLGYLRLSPGSPCIDAADNDSVPPDTADLDGDSDTAEPLPLDVGGVTRFLDDTMTPDTGHPGVVGPPVVDMGAYECAFGCGNDVVDPGEECDAGPSNSDTQPDACRTDCRHAWCGDGVVDTGEECDDGNTSNEDACLNTCDGATCGDGFIWADVEGCDDGNTADCDGCRGDCSEAEGTCGNGTLDPMCEVCDDGNNSDCDGCRGDCSGVEGTCGDGTRDPVCEACDDGNNIDGDGCQGDCALPFCGDGIVDPGEQCDDGNTQAGDGCDATCHIEAGSIPTVSGWGMVVMTLLLLTGLRIEFGRRSPAQGTTS